MVPDWHCLIFWDAVFKDRSEGRILVDNSKKKPTTAKMAAARSVIMLAEEGEEASSGESDADDDEEKRARKKTRKRKPKSVQVSTSFWRPFRLPRPATLAH